MSTPPNDKDTPSVTPQEFATGGNFKHLPGWLIRDPRIEDALLDSINPRNSLPVTVGQDGTEELRDPDEEPEILDDDLARDRHGHEATITVWSKMKKEQFAEAVAQSRRLLEIYIYSRYLNLRDGRRFRTVVDVLAVELFTRGLVKESCEFIKLAITINETAALMKFPTATLLGIIGLVELLSKEGETEEITEYLPIMHERSSRLLKANSPARESVLEALAQGKFSHARILLLENARLHGPHTGLDDQYFACVAMQYLIELTLNGSWSLAQYYVKTGAFSIDTGKNPHLLATATTHTIVVSGHDLRDDSLVFVFEPNVSYTLRFQVSAPAPHILLSTDGTLTDVPLPGLAAEWIVTSTDVDFSTLVQDVGKAQHTHFAKFNLFIPHAKDSKAVDLTIRTMRDSGTLQLTLMVAGEPYRRAIVTLHMGARLERDVVLNDPSQVGIKQSNDWIKPSNHITISVTGQGKASVRTVSGDDDYGEVTWYGTRAKLHSPIVRVRRALEHFKDANANKLNEIDWIDINERLISGSWRVADWKDIPASTSSSTEELHALASDGFRLFTRCFPKHSKLRKILKSLPRGSQVDFYWYDGSGDWSPHVPWSLMYTKRPVRGQPIDWRFFLGFRLRIGSNSWEPKNTSRSLGDPQKSNVLHFLYWGKDENDRAWSSSRWQRSAFANWERQYFVPDLDLPEPKNQVLNSLETPKPAPAVVLHIFCHCAVKDGSEPTLYFSDGDPRDCEVNANDLCGDDLTAGPVVFANACSTSAGDPQNTSELEASFFDRGARAFLGTEVKIPAILASQFAYLFFYFLLRKSDPLLPISVGEALTQARLFLWTQYRNPGGLFYCLVNQYHIYFASVDELRMMRRS